MARIDQRLRRLAQKTNEWNVVKQKDIEHATEFKKIVSTYGWPTIPMVDEKTSKNAWLLVQHSDHDLPFQKHCLKLMKNALKKYDKSISKTFIAYLTDRVLTAEGKKQLFGTQFKRNADGNMTLKPISDRRNVNKRRNGYGMETLEEYLKKTLSK